jgi:recombinational DNA repair ATPase RecF
MDDALLSAVVERLADRSLSPEAEDLLLAALDGDDALNTQLSAAPAHRYARAATDWSAAGRPVGAYLTSVTVAGFRGIGPAATLKVGPGPGLTLVVGRNGSGKSSFAEALEMLLTGTLMRWAPPAPAVVREGWRSKHAGGDTTEITAEFLIEGSGTAVVSRTWGVDAQLDGSTAWLQHAGEEREPLSNLGWDTDLREYRPFLSHAELEAFFGRPSELYDLLASVLGLEDLTNADRRLNGARKAREDALAVVKRRLESLLTQVRPLADRDERAQACLYALPGGTPARWDLTAAKAAATGATAVDGSALAELRALARLAPPPAADVTGAIVGARDAAAGLREVAGTNAAYARELAGLLDAALGHHQAHGDGDCPVCGTSGALTAAWRATSEQHRDRLREEAAAANAAIAQARAASSRALALITPLPPALAAATDAVDLSPAREAWSAWSVPITRRADRAERSEGAEPTPDSLTSLAQHLTTTFPVLASAVTAIAEAAAQELAHRDDQWIPVAADLAAWCADAAQAISGSGPVACLKLARKWLAETVDELRDQRLAPLAGRSRAIWADLRQESNIDLGAFRLAGTNTTRRLDLDVSIDGESGAALGVMSQGEINALALSIFLPRAMLPDSPFNFLVIDDPVQAMDPAKVDGLAKVLDKVSRQRQLIVFTHDNRLAAAVKDLSIPATVVEVTRQPKSQVNVRDCLDASGQAIKDARSLRKDSDIPIAVAERVIPGLCRTAVEAAFTSAYWRSALSQDRSRAEIEQAVEPNGKRVTLRGIAQLAIFGEPKDASVPEYVGRQWGSRYAKVYRALNRGAHEGYSGALDTLIEDAEALVRKIAEKLP